MAFSWCKVASNLDSHPKIRKAGRLGREVFLFALRRNAEPGNKTAGVVSLSELEPWYIADQLQMTCDEAVTGVTSAVTAGLLRKTDSGYLITGFDDEWSKGPTPGKQRTAKWRENKKLDSGVTKRDASNVTQSHGDARDAREERRGEENKESGSPDGLALLFDKVDQTGGETGQARNAKAAKRRAAANPDHQAAIDAFHQLFKAKYGTKPDWNGKSIGLLSSLLKRHPLSVLLERMDFMFTGQAKWPPGPYSAEVFVQHFDRWVSEVPAVVAPIRRIPEL